MLFELIVDHDLDFLAITETWCSKDSTVSLAMISPPGFSVLHTPREGRGGGLALVFKDIFKVKLNKVKSYTTFEYQLVSVSFGHVNLKVALFYKPSGVFDDLFQAQFNDCLGHLLSLGSSSPLLLGDFNFHVDDPTDVHANKFLNTISMFDLSQHIKVPTHQAGHTLDLIITREDVEIDHVTVDSSINSDHQAVLFDISLPRPPRPKSLIHYRKWRQVHTPTFLNDLIGCFHNFPTSLEDGVSQYFSRIQSIANKHAPIKVKVFTMRKDSPWYTENLANEKRLRRRLERKAYRTSCESDFASYV